MKIEKMEPLCNLSTVKDGRGGIFSFLPHKPIVEFNFVYINKGHVRGNHCHPEFDEYYLITSGNGVVVTKADENGKQEFIYMGKGDCVYIPQGTFHVFYAITDCTKVSLLTKKWNDCKNPIIHENLGMGVGDHGDPNYTGPK